MATDAVRRNRGLIVDTQFDPKEYLVGSIEDYTIPPDDTNINNKTPVPPKPHRSAKNRSILKGKPNAQIPQVKLTNNIYAEEQRQLRLQKEIQRLARDPTYVTD